MPRYFFHTLDGQRYPDEEGTELPDLVSARRRATRVLAELLKEQPDDFLGAGHLQVLVTDEQGRPVSRVDVSLSS